MITQNVSTLTLGLPIKVENPRFKIADRVVYIPYFYHDPSVQRLAWIEEIHLSITDNYESVDWEYWIKYDQGGTIYEEMVSESELQHVIAF